MATNKSKTKSKAKSKSRVSSGSQMTQFTFKWWMALVLVGIVAVIGLVVVRFSNASGFTFTYYGSANCRWESGTPYCQNGGERFTFTQGFGGTGFNYECPPTGYGERRQCFTTGTVGGMKY
ncbi:hypothetical protein H0W80_03245 [Candidatus Saccharibacteria bacterium]|nr:hypothetical protein [Candidatus Saccharibacteria bacterium]